MNGKLAAWPFLVSRNLNVDYRPVVAPAFLSNQYFSDEPWRRLSALLWDATLGDQKEQERKEPGQVIYREIHSTQGGSISLIFRMVEAQQRHIGYEGNEPLFDPTKTRRIDLVEGILVVGHRPEMIVTERDLQKAYKQVEQAYVKFWKSDDVSFPDIPSQPIFLEGEEATGINLLPSLKEKPPYKIQVSLLSLETDELKELKPLLSLETDEQKELVSIGVAARQESLSGPTAQGGSDPEKNGSPPASGSQPGLPLQNSWITGLIVVVLLLLAGWIILPGIINQKGQPTATATIPTPKQTLTQFCNALQGGDYQTAYNQLSSQVQQSMTEPDFASFFSAPDHQIASCAFSSPQGDANRRTATLTLTYKDRPDPDTLTITLTRENTSDWKINENIVQKVKNLQSTPAATLTSTPTAALTPTPTLAPSQSLRK